MKPEAAELWSPLVFLIKVAFATKVVSMRRSVCSCTVIGPYSAQVTRDEGRRAAWLFFAVC